LDRYVYGVDKYTCELDLSTLGNNKKRNKTILDKIIYSKWQNNNKSNVPYY